MNLLSENMPVGVGLLGMAAAELQKEAGIKDSLRAGALSLGLMASPAIAKTHTPFNPNNAMIKTLMKYEDYVPKITFKDVNNYEDLMKVIRERKLPIDNVKIPIYSKRF